MIIIIVEKIFCSDSDATSKLSKRFIQPDSKQTIACIEPTITIEQTPIIVVSVVSVVSRFFSVVFEMCLSVASILYIIAIVINKKYEKILSLLETLYGQWIYIVTSISYIMYLSWCFIWLYTEIWFQGKQQFFFVVLCADGADKTEKKNVFFLLLSNKLNEVE